MVYLSIYLSIDLEHSLRVSGFGITVLAVCTTLKRQERELHLLRDIEKNPETTYTQTF